MSDGPMMAKLSETALATVNVAVGLATDDIGLRETVEHLMAGGKVSVRINHRSIGTDNAVVFADVSAGLLITLKPVLTQQHGTPMALPGNLHDQAVCTTFGKITIETLDAAGKLIGRVG